MNCQSFITERKDDTYIYVDDTTHTIIHSVRGILLHDAVLANLVRIAGLA